MEHGVIHLLVGAYSENETRNLENEERFYCDVQSN